MYRHNPEKVIIGSITIPASIDEVWRAWTTEEGVKTFFAPDCHIELKPGGAYEIFFNPGAPPGERGGEGNIVLAYHEPTMFSFTWNSPPHLSEVRQQMTHVMIRLGRLRKRKPKCS